ncbi:hypothetical protein EAG_10332 [Camponotus floridanus]|uniref:Uncharacterized protein n=1 Tax=Camponotus floridanus TaxID=104421 RepID=E2AM24_CAMFO|nr:hypothetical protein EAG_10332 [Camponotus floridanus]
MKRGNNCVIQTKDGYGYAPPPLPAFPTLEAPSPGSSPEGAAVPDNWAFFSRSQYRCQKMQHPSREYYSFVENAKWRSDPFAGISDRAEMTNATI